MRWLDGITIINGHEFEQTPGDREFAQTGKPGVLQSMGLQRVRHSLATEQEQKHPSITQIDSNKGKIKPPKGLSDQPII